MASISETNPTRLRKRILIKTTIDDRPRHKHQFGTLPYKEVLERIIKWKQDKKKKRQNRRPRRPVRFKNLLHQKTLADLVFGWTKGVTCIVLLFFLL